MEQVDKETLLKVMEEVLDALKMVETAVSDRRRQASTSDSFVIHELKDIARHVRDISLFIKGI